jgi:hypothetical protein
MGNDDYDISNLRVYGSITGLLVMCLLCAPIYALLNLFGFYGDDVEIEP